MQPLAFFAILKRKTADNNNNYEAKAVTSLYKKNPVSETIDTCMIGIEDLYECVKRMRNEYVNNKELQQRASNSSIYWKDHKEKRKERCNWKWTINCWRDKSIADKERIDGIYEIEKSSVHCLISYM